MPTNSEMAARRDIDLYKKAVQKFGRIVVPMLNDIPKSLAFAHILRTNRDLEGSPDLTWDQRKGFMRVTHAATAGAGVSWNDAEALDKNAYVWGWDLNTAGPSLAHMNPSFFPEPSEDYWKCVYAQHALTPQVFNFLWKRRNPTLKSQYDAVVYGVTSWRKRISGWPYVRLRHLVTVELPYVFAVAKTNGTLSSKGFGIRPVLTASRTQQTLL